METIHWLFLLGIVLCSFSGVFGIVKARRRREPIYYCASAVCFLVVIAFIVALFNQFLLSFATLVATGIVSIVMLPRVMSLYRKEIVKQKQETDASAPLRLKDFLTWKAWIKLEALYGFHKMITLYTILNIGIIAAGLLTLIIIDMITLSIAISYTVSTTLIFLTMGYRQLRKALKNS